MTKYRLKPGERPFFADTSWTVVQEAESVRYKSSLKRHVDVRCDCGKEKCIDLGALVRGTSKSCGCIRNQQTRERATRHGMTLTPLHVAWRSMRLRCTDLYQSRKPTYKGVRHCAEWSTFEGFLANQPPGRGFSPGLVLARNGDVGNYEPTNTRWATRSENTRDVVERLGLRTTSGELLVDVARRNGIPPATARQRAYAYGWSIDDAVTTPVSVKFRRKVAS